MQRDDLIAYLADFLKVEEIDDVCPNGLQVEGKREVRKAVVSVSASEELFQRARVTKADMVIVHHGIIWKGGSGVVKGSYRKRIWALLEPNISLLAYHLPLDRHESIGNNALAAHGLGLHEVRPFGKYHGKIIGFAGMLPDGGMGGPQFFKKVEDFYGNKSLVFSFGPERIERVGIISGGAQEDIHEAVSEKMHAFITGEVSEYVMQLAKEEHIHFIAAGHYATERLGIKALGAHLSENFDIEVEYIDVPVPV
ncbi:MAG: Nif3-like dinuclear metal center hexameric protein [Candidatus Raymondbacteria bacterium RifOxyA12_full_50_37]|uniref:GTP cyclohydrolase 1 type 2 homolog n=1 Tax=Candidatus Raymondbacteria bacterium RIFOXYD12_FULL_49_13 TaxID=1817890 RepID=A0A1F7FL00_UNCRA|nr:MAG: Nif3-like dinuclear metal center hexameric protein [Candidatus Raymondbacteria bacterium RifOxyA12_full_50_37]OGJ90192.1 MAG: Nif3-like dinuclear metal center hexameric protein [Candidatus Raymondbacteria bacterium RIFOXYA2_FULL_49_16]OGJ97263.1 MAG: Nif3-like dinuclear metal center hexameric protein [Candidatus Raymondbacteria bacterium RIFOXYC2_FULL_50_21]OGJ98843.1 MAG: Nif3-like dinuclear metal center hexameric protein [Candidatus Raymondbacteria bacterium RifOxyB12_full_50_8]OGK071